MSFVLQHMGKIGFGVSILFHLFLLAQFSVGAMAPSGVNSVTIEVADNPFSNAKTVTSQANVTSQIEAQKSNKAADRQSKITSLNREVAGIKNSPQMRASQSQLAAISSTAENAANDSSEISAQANSVALSQTKAFKDLDVDLSAPSFDARQDQAIALQPSVNSLTTLVRSSSKEASSLQSRPNAQSVQALEATKIQIARRNSTQAQPVNSLNFNNQSAQNQRSQAQNAEIAMILQSLPQNDGQVNFSKTLPRQDVDRVAPSELQAYEASRQLGAQIRGTEVVDDMRASTQLAAKPDLQIAQIETPQRALQSQSNISFQGPKADNSKVIPQVQTRSRPVLSTSRQAFQNLNPSVDSKRSTPRLARAQFATNPDAVLDPFLQQKEAEDVQKRRLDLVKTDQQVGRVEVNNDAVEFTARRAQLNSDANAQTSMVVSQNQQSNLTSDAQQFSVSSEVQQSNLTSDAQQLSVSSEVQQSNLTSDVQQFSVFSDGVVATTDASQGQDVAIALENLVREISRSAAAGTGVVFEISELSINANAEQRITTAQRVQSRLTQSLAVAGQVTNSPQISSLAARNVALQEPTKTARLIESAETQADNEAGLTPQLSVQAAITKYMSNIRKSIRDASFYPVAAAKEALRGQAIVSFSIQADGSVQDVKIVRTSGHPILDDAAKQTIEAAAPFSVPPNYVGLKKWTVRLPIRFG